MPAQAQYAPTPRIIDNDRLDNAPPVRPPSSGVIGTRPAASPETDRSSAVRFTLHDVRVAGVTQLPPSAIAQSWSALRGKAVTTKDIYAIADRIGQLYAARDYALYSVIVPKQDFNDGIAVIQIVEGYIDNVVIDGDTRDADLSLLQKYVGQLTRQKPLRQSILERYLLLAEDIPGLTLNTQFESTGVPGAVTLHMTLVRKRFELGASINNLGANVLGRTQFEVDGFAHSLVRQGDTTQLIYGFPQQFDRYQFYALAHEQPVGHDGLRAGVLVGHLTTQPANSAEGEATTGSLYTSYPLVRSLKKNVQLSAAFDTLNSENAILGSTIANERTRAIRLGTALQYSDAADNVSGANIVVSGGLDGLGARRGSVIYGDPAFAKANVKLSHDRALPFELIGRGKIATQYAGESLPSSEQFLYGGAEFGRAFDAGIFTGDTGVAGSLEIAHPLESLTYRNILTYSEIYGYADGAVLANTDNPFLPSSEKAGSGGIGMRFNVYDKASLQIEGAKSLGSSDNIAQDEERLTFSVRSLF